LYARLLIESLNNAMVNRLGLEMSFASQKLLSKFTKNASIMLITRHLNYKENKVHFLTRGLEKYISRNITDPEDHEVMLCFSARPSEADREVEGWLIILRVWIGPYWSSYFWILSVSAAIRRFACSGVIMMRAFTFARGTPGIKADKVQYKFTV
jgi:hypothetical protein